MILKKTIVLLLIMLLAATAWSQNNSLDKDIIFDPETLLVDVRTKSEYESGHISGAENIPFRKITEEIIYFAPDKEKTIVVYCQSGSRANFAANILKELGYKNVINAGTYKNLKKLQKMK